MKFIIQTGGAPAAIGPYSQGVRARASEFLFLSGQIGLDPQTGELVPGDIEAQTERVLRNLEGVLRAAGSSLDHVVKTTIYLTDMDEFPRVNKVYEKFFGESLPARATVGVSSLPKGALVEVEALAVVG
ncbi:MAG: RidA family protein [Acidobacteriota bacterium]|nr:RidA family protein [Acidobacteriota bacterium]